MEDSLAATATAIAATGWPDGVVARVSD